MVNLGKDHTLVVVNDAVGASRCCRVVTMDSYCAADIFGHCCKMSLTALLSSVTVPVQRDNTTSPIY